MNVSKRIVRCAVAIVIPFFAALPLAHTQTTSPKTEQKPLMAEDFFKNVQLLKGISVKEFMDTMGFFSAATGMSLRSTRIPFF